MGVSMRRAPTEVWPKSLWSIGPALALHQVAKYSIGHTSGQRITVQEQNMRQSTGSRGWTCTQILQQLSMWSPQPCELILGMRSAYTK